MADDEDSYIVYEGALKHSEEQGFTREDLIHAYRNIVYVFEQDEKFVMYVGPSRSGELMEVGVVPVRDYPEMTLIVHGFMPARDQYLRLPDRPRRRRER